MPHSVRDLQYDHSKHSLLVLRQTDRQTDKIDKQTSCLKSSYACEREALKLKTRIFSLQLKCKFEQEI